MGNPRLRSGHSSTQRGLARQIIQQQPQMEQVAEDFTVPLCIYHAASLQNGVTPRSLHSAQVDRHVSFNRLARPLAGRIRWKCEVMVSASHHLLWAGNIPRVCGIDTRVHVCAQRYAPAFSHPPRVRPSTPFASPR